MRYSILTALVVAAVLYGCEEDRRPGFARALDEARTALDAPGAVFGLGHPDGRVEVFASGVADLDSGRAIRPDDAYFLGSVTKIYTAALILRLAEEGKLSLEDRLDRYLPDFPRSGEITVRHLLQHTSGLRDFFLYLYLRPSREEMIEQVTRTWSQDEMLRLSARFGHSFEPGADWSYSNTNYFLLGVVAERASGMSLAMAYRSYLLDPLGL